MPPETRQKGFYLSEEVCQRLDEEKHGQQTKIVEEQLRAYYGMEPLYVEFER